MEEAEKIAYETLKNCRINCDDFDSFGELEFDILAKVIIKLLQFYFHFTQRKDLKPKIDKLKETISKMI